MPQGPGYGRRRPGPTGRFPITDEEVPGLERTALRTSRTARDRRQHPPGPRRPPRGELVPAARRGPRRLRRSPRRPGRSRSAPLRRAAAPAPRPVRARAHQEVEPDRRGGRRLRVRHARVQPFVQRAAEDRARLPDPRVAGQAGRHPLLRRRFGRHARDGRAQARARGLGMPTGPTAVNVPFVARFLNAEGEFVPNEATVKGADQMLEELARWAEAMRVVRREGVAADWAWEPGSPR